jgi:hypothetical protein
VRTGSHNWEYGVDRGGVLVVPAGPHDRCALLRLLPDRVELVAGRARCELPWSGFRPRPTDVPGGPPGWGVTAWTFMKNQPFGAAIPVGLAVHGCAGLDGAFATVVAATRSRRDVLQGDLLVPLVRDQEPWWSAKGPDLHHLDTVLRVLAARPDVRARLAEPDRVGRLALELTTSSVGAAPDPGGIRRSTTEVIAALRMAGYRHPLGRPLPCEPLPPLAEVVAAVEARLAANPFMEGRHIERHRVEHVVRDAYLDVEPWPFGALTCD